MTHEANTFSGCSALAVGGGFRLAQEECSDLDYGEYTLPEEDCREDEIIRPKAALAGGLSG